VVAEALGAAGGSSSSSSQQQPDVLEVGAMPRQGNGHACGVYACAVAAALGEWCGKSSCCADEEPHMGQWLTPSYITQMRQDMRALIQQLRDSGRFAPRA
jgi:Ulp1 family protease